MGRTKPPSGGRQPEVVGKRHSSPPPRRSTRSGIIPLGLHRFRYMLRLSPAPAPRLRPRLRPLPAPARLASDSQLSLTMAFTLRLAKSADIPALRALIDLSVRTLQTVDYSAEQIEAALLHVYGVDTQLISDGTYFAVEPAERAGPIIGCGGWSKRRTLYGGDNWSSREDSLLDASKEPAKIRAFFVHPGWVRRGIASLILDACESAALRAGFKHLEMGATLTGVPFYSARGYRERERNDASLGNGMVLPILRMEKTLGIDTLPGGRPT